MSIKINGTVFDVGVAGIVRSFRRSEKYRVTTEDGVVHREVRATYLDATISLGNVGQTDYDEMMELLRGATDDVTVELPRGAYDMETYTGTFDSIGDSVACDDGYGVIWDSLTLSFVGTVPLEV